MKGYSILNFLDILSTTDKAWLLKFDNNKNVWLPKSQCNIDIDKHQITLPSWLAREKGFY